MKGLTKRQKMVLDFIVQRINEVGYPPTIREIGEHMEISSTNGVSDHLRALVRKGFLVRDESKSRALRPLMHKIARRQKAKEVEGDVRRVPLVGDIAAGAPIVAEERIEEYLNIDPSLLSNDDGHEIFALRVSGDSMIEDGILDGDLIFVRKQNIAKRGDIVAALIEGEATVKRFFPLRNAVHLKPANAAMEPIIVNKAEFRDTQLLGVVVGVYRRVN